MNTTPITTHVLVIGGGFSGIALGRGLLQQGITDFLIIDRNHQFGGCWSDNTYPGVACDVPSHLYSFSWRPNPDFSRVYGTGPEIRQYLEDTALELGLDQHYRPGENLESATYRDGGWDVKTDQASYRCTVLITATGHLIDPKIPDTDFAGEVLHSAAWDHSVDLAGKRVAVVGTGASAIQVVPAIADTAAEVTVFQRTPAWIIPREDRAYTEAEKRTFARVPEALEAERAYRFWHGEALYPAMRGHAGTQAMLKKLADAHRANLIEDEALREKLTPTYAPGCKRVLVANDFYHALNRDNVELVASALDHAQGHTLVAADGTTIEADVLIFCTGFDVAEPVYAEKVFNDRGESLSQAWGRGDVLLHTLFAPDFPNLIAVNARHTGLGHNSLVHIIETQVDAAMQALKWNAATFQARRDAHDAYAHKLAEMAQGTVWTEGGGCGAWYVDGRTNTLTAVWPGFAFELRQQLREIPQQHFQLN
ncbi:flavin-containing monooxygenase [Corynebacterium aquilae]|uniref:Monooxygenase n=1 Tax=Corynebacterium aquilae DSM 44791 TaxID=1431546 RepID=A0A1L7CHC5_9CORY|nr:NAD(P)/FAD-dependent oxidoreductase [Corynebacterium aquilae]APT85257.1 hypothetical protein CAQU_09450 [Corynebacterium aquilae DSM 44791]